MASSPSLRDQLRPFELVIVSAVMGVFIGLIVLLVSRDFWLATIWFGIGFIVALVGLAMSVLIIKPNKRELGEIAELDSLEAVEQARQAAKKPVAASKPRAKTQPKK